MKRILFVDDDLAILEALRTSLRKERGRWEMVIAVGGEAGLSELRQHPFDVIVSDLQMPGMNGVQFLARARELMPDAVRIMLTGAPLSDIPERGVIASAILAKPCDGNILKATLERACEGPQAFLASGT